MRRLILIIATLLIFSACNSAPVANPTSAPAPSASAPAATNTLPPIETSAPIPTLAVTLAPTDAPTLAPSSTVAPTQAPTSAPSTATVPSGGAVTYTSQVLGISFMYLPHQGGETVGTFESGDKVYVFAGNTPPTQGQWVQVFQKAANDSLEDAIKKTLMKNYSPQDCLVVKTSNPVGGQTNPPSYVFAKIDVPHLANEPLPTLTAKAQKCPQPYTAFGGIAYFMQDTNHPDRFLFFSIGQYAILSANNQPWQNSIKLLDSGSTSGGTSNAYLDDRSTAQSVITSHVNALNLKQYLRAYSYWNLPPGSPSAPQSFEQFQAGYANTASIQLKIGTVTGDVGAGQLYYSVPVTLIAQTTSAATQTFVGCYILHLANPAIQASPPSHPLGIESAKVQQVANNVKTDDLMSHACEIQGQALTPTAVGDPANIDATRYLDDRSDAVQVLRSLFNAVNRKEYVRAYSYWEPGAAQPQPFAQFQQGYANTASVQLMTGAVGSDSGAGQLYYTVPVLLVAKTTDNATQTFAGCYTLHLSRPEIQGVPPFQPLGIRSANIHVVANGAGASAMPQSCVP